MTSVEQTSAVIAFSIKKLFTFKNGALPLIASPASFGLTEVITILIADTSKKDLLIPVAVTAVVLAMYFMVWLFDFVLGVRASKHEAQGEPDWFDSSKAWSSCIKFFVVIIVMCSLMFLSCITSIAGWWGAPTALTMSLGAFGLMASLFDLYSIGENQKRLTGKKAPIFLFLEKVGNTVETRFISKITSW